MKQLIDYRIVTGIILLVLAYAFIPRSEVPERHHHQIVTCQYAMGHKSVNLVFCHTEQAQVGFNNVHRDNLRAERFFKGELRGCK